jgi:hypothetical protein
LRAHPGTRRAALVGGPGQGVELGDDWLRQAAVGQFLKLVGEPAFEEGPVDAGRFGAEQVLGLQVGQGSDLEAYAASLQLLSSTVQQFCAAAHSRNGGRAGQLTVPALCHEPAKKCAAPTLNVDAA